jgi:hypothetical protein
MSFVVRLKAGRSEALSDLISKVRDCFDENSEKGELLFSKIGDLLRHAGIPVNLTEHSLSQYLERLQRQGREFVSLPEIFEHFGFIFQDLADQSVGIAEGFAMLRMKCKNDEVRSAAEYLLGILDKIINRPKDTRFWSINISDEVCHILFIIHLTLLQYGISYP